MLPGYEKFMNLRNFTWRDWRVVHHKSTFHFVMTTEILKLTKAMQGGRVIFMENQIEVYY